MPKDSHSDSRPASRPIDRIALEDGTTLEIWRGASADELTVKLASSGEELPFLRVACPSFVPVVVLASALYTEVLGVSKELGGTFEVVTSRGTYRMKRDPSGAWRSEWLNPVAVVKAHNSKHYNRNRTEYQRWS